jgi:hypothetical protein
MGWWDTIIYAIKLIPLVILVLIVIVIIATIIDSCVNKWKTSPPVTMHDPYFGDLVRSYNDWTGHIYFSPLGAEISVALEAEEQGPTEAQREFFRQIESRYAALLKDMEALFLEEYHYPERTEPTPRELFDGFKLELIALPSEMQSPVIWAAYYSSPFDVCPDVGVEMVQFNLSTQLS